MLIMLMDLLIEFKVCVYQVAFSQCTEEDVAFDDLSYNHCCHISDMVGFQQY